MKCPFYNEVNACKTHADCLFNRESNCAVILAAKFSEKASEEIAQLGSKISKIEYLLNSIKDKLG